MQFNGIFVIPVNNNLAFVALALLPELVIFPVLDQKPFVN